MKRPPSTESGTTSKPSAENPDNESRRSGRTESDRPELSQRLRRFRNAYAEHRRREGRDDSTPLHEYPNIRNGPLRKMWSVRTRSYETVVRSVIEPFESANTGATLTTTDLGAGNGWFSYQMARRGHNAIAVDIRSDDVDGLGVVDSQRVTAPTLKRVVGDFSRLPLACDVTDICVFNAAFHYATSVPDILREAVRVTRPGGRILIVDTPFYDTEEDGERMVAEKQRQSQVVFGDLAEDLTSIPFIEFLTPGRLIKASEELGIAWNRHRVRYPLWYELRPWIARVKRARPPSRFEVWEGVVP